MNLINLETKLKISQVPVTAPQIKNGLLVKLEAAAPKVDFGETSVTMALLLDNSGSMNGTPRREAVKALRELTECLRPQDRVLGIGFGTEVNIFHELHQSQDHLRRFGDYDYYNENIGASGRTNMLDAINLAVDKLRGIPNARIVVLTDGRPEDRGKVLKAAERAANENIRIVGLGFGSKYDHEFLSSVSETSGDTAYIMAEFAEAAEVFADRILSVQHEVTTSIRLEVEFLGDHSVLRSALISPYIHDYGPVRMDATQRRWSIDLPAIQDDKPLEVMIDLLHSQQQPGRRQIARVKAIYDIPSLGITRQTHTADVTLEASQSITTPSQDYEVVQKIRELETERLRIRAERAIKDGDDKEAGRFLETMKKVTNRPEMRAYIDETIKKVRGGSQGVRELQLLSNETQKKSARRERR